MLESIYKDLSAMRQLKLAENVSEVSLDRFFADEKRVGNFTVASAISELPHYRQFTFG